MINNSHKGKKFYYPYCKENKCKGVLKIKINNNFSVDYECDQNENHKGNNIFFKTFERFYLKEQSIDECSNSSCEHRLDTNNIYKCKKCDNIYCSNCFILDQHIKKDINNLIMQIQKCPLHNMELTQFCTDCKQYLCIYCIKDNDELISHKEHSIKNILEFMPSIKEINAWNDKVNLKTKYNKELINLIEEWEKSLIKKIEQFKKNLKDEIDFYEKIFINYNLFFINYSYYLNFKYLDNYLKGIDYDFINYFKKISKIEEKTKMILELINLKKEEDKIELKKANLKRYYTINEGILTKLNNEYFFDYSNFHKSVHLTIYDEEKDSMQYLKKSNTEIKDKIFSVYFSEEKNQIYACLLNEKKVKIFECDLDEGTLIMNDEEIYDKNNIDGHYNKCISLINEYYATIDDKKIIIWYKEIKKNIYSIVNYVTLNRNISDILYVNNEYLITSLPTNNIIKFFDTKTLNCEKIIKDVDFVESQNIFFIFNEYILVNCQKGIVLILIKTKDNIQYIDTSDYTPKNKEIYINDDESIYILFKMNITFMKIFKLKMIDGIFRPIVEYEKIDINEKCPKMFCINKDNKIIWGKGVYLLKE